ncbi:hypothetical protein ABEY80_22000 [Priestia megaterium]
MAEEVVIKIDKAFGKKLAMIVGGILLLVVCLIIMNNIGAGSEREAIKEVEETATETIEFNAGASDIEFEDVSVKKSETKEDYYYVEAEVNYITGIDTEASQNISYELQYKDGSWEILKKNHYNVG